MTLIDPPATPSEDDGRNERIRALVGESRRLVSNINTKLHEIEKLLAGDWSDGETTEQS